MVGLEIHQQLATGKKLFCDCPPTEPDRHDYPVVFRRRLRSSSGELGGHDPAALFEDAKAGTVTYCANPESSCLVEMDEEPPHDLDSDAKKTALTIAASLKSRIYTELHTMRKIVVDGSNTAGFQRTMLVSEGGEFEVTDDPARTKQNVTVGIQSICLEEDAAKILKNKDGDGTKRYGLERLGVPLVEIATEPFSVSDYKIVKTVALNLGRILRSTRMVTRGLGSIRQDVNVSIRDGRGTVVEVKGVQQLEQLGDVVAYEAQRQHGLLLISDMLRSSGWRHDVLRDRADATKILKGSSSKIIRTALKRRDHAIVAVAFRGAGGIFGYEPYEGVRLGREIADLVRLFGIGGIFHSDELPAYGITEQDVTSVAELLQAEQGRDAFLILTAPQARADVIVDQIISRVDRIASEGVPADTRMATPDGKTVFMRPRPGAARMYPETDVPTITVTADEIDNAVANIPKSWNESISGLQATYGIGRQLAEQLLDSERLELFEGIAERYVKDIHGEKAGKAGPAFLASVLCSSITSLGRQKELDAGLLDDKAIRETFELLERGEIAKESIEIIFKWIMLGKAQTVSEAIEAASIRSVGTDELAKVIQSIIHDNIQMVTNQKERAAGPLMGMAMKQLRGRAPGKTINALVVSGIAEVLEKIRTQGT